MSLPDSLPAEVVLPDGRLEKMVGGEEQFVVSLTPGIGPRSVALSTVPRTASRPPFVGEA